MGETEQGLSWFPRPPPAHTATYCKILKKEKKEKTKQKNSYANDKNQTNKKILLQMSSERKVRGDPLFSSIEK